MQKMKEWKRKAAEYVGVEDQSQQEPESLQDSIRETICGICPTLTYVCLL